VTRWLGLGAGVCGVGRGGVRFTDLGVWGGRGPKGGGSIGE